jgi:predicted O-methyltransferase YrrM
VAGLYGKRCCCRSKALDMMQAIRKTAGRFRERFLTKTIADVRVSGIVNSRDTFPDTEHVIQSISSPWEVSPDMGRCLVRAAVRDDVISILEFGAGVSSLLLAKGLDRSPGGRLTSIEQYPNWCKEHWEIIQKMSSVDGRLVKASYRMVIGKGGAHFAAENTDAVISERGPYELVFIDAPQWYFGRDGALYQCFSHITRNGLIILDDAGRANEKWTLFRWLRVYPGLSLVYYNPGFGGRGMAVLRKDDQHFSRFDPLSFVTGIYHACMLAKRRRDLNLSSLSRVDDLCA